MNFHHIAGKAHNYDSNDKGEEGEFYIPVDMIRYMRKHSGTEIHFKPEFFELGAGRMQKRFYLTSEEKEFDNLKKLIDEQFKQTELQKAD